MRTILILGALSLGACAEEGGKNDGGFDKAPDFSLEDVNTTSQRFGQIVSPLDYEGQVSAWYFGHANCPICSKRFGELDVMQAEFDADGTPIDILGINGIGFEESNATITDGRDIPWLQDVAGEDVWEGWLAEWRDLVVIDGNRELVFRTNLTDLELSEPAVYDDLKQDLLDAIE